MAGSVCAASSGGARRIRGSVSTAVVMPCLPFCVFIEDARVVMTWWVRANLAFFPEPNSFASTVEAHSDSSSVALLLFDIFEEERLDWVSRSRPPNSGPCAAWAPLMSCGSSVNWCCTAFISWGVRWPLDFRSEMGSWPRFVITLQPLISAPASNAIRRRVATSPDSVARSSMRFAIFRCPGVLKLRCMAAFCISPLLAPLAG
mmetsp:Transcript_14765/g.44341  ORF Transcript_14765/g.44341 Transcript_14765/m.44341 type:complete len:203 (-) Transcript_14765:93-701(-)